MTAAELDELEAFCAKYEDGDSEGPSWAEVDAVLVKLPALITIARSAEGLAESLEAVLSEYDQGQACYQARLELEGYRKVQP